MRHLLHIFFITTLFWFAFGNYAYGETKRYWAPSVMKVAAASPTVSPTLKGKATAAIFSPILNFKLSALGPAEMIAQKDTILSLRADMDLIVSNRVALGPSVVFRRASVWHDDSVVNGSPFSMDESVLDVGWLTSIYLTGTTNSGGLILRPHLYYVSVTGVGSDSSSDSLAPTHLRDGIRSGAEFLYQKVLGNGFNFEAGAGFSYFLLPYEIEYPNQIKTTPENRLAPSLTVSIGWAF